MIRKLRHRCPKRITKVTRRLDEVLAVAAVDPHFADTRVGGGDLVEQGGAGGVLHARRGDQHRDEEPERVGDDAPPSGDVFLPGVDALAGGVGAGGGLDTLGVNHTGRWLGVPAFLLPQELPEQAAHLGEHALVCPCGEVAVDRVPVWEVVREVAPLESGVVHVQDRVHDVAQVVLGWPADQGPAAAVEAPGGKDRIDQLPAGIGQITRISASPRHACGVPPRTACAQAHAMTVEAHDREGRASWDETGVRRPPPHPQPREPPGVDRVHNPTRTAISDLKNRPIPDQMR